LSYIEPANDGGARVAVERRGQRRQRVLLTGKLVYPSSGYKADCTIRDMSDGGARIAIMPGALAEGPYLIVARHGLVHEVEVAWLTARQAGLKFVKTFDLKDPVSTPEAGFKRIWLGMQP
jgi:hypothetical protein